MFSNNDSRVYPDSAVSTDCDEESLFDLINFEEQPGGEAFSDEYLEEVEFWSGIKNDEQEAGAEDESREDPHSGVHFDAFIGNVGRQESLESIDAFLEHADNSFEDIIDGLQNPNTQSDPEMLQGNRTGTAPASNEVAENRRLDFVDPAHIMQQSPEQASDASEAVGSSPPLDISEERLAWLLESEISSECHKNDSSDVYSNEISVEPQEQLHTNHHQTTSANMATKRTISEMKKYAAAHGDSNSEIQLDVWSYNSERVLPPVSQFRKPNGIKALDQLPEELLADGHIYEIGSKAGYTEYEPLIVRNVERSAAKTAEGLCPYCEEIRFLKMSDSSYLHHLNLCHGIFSTGDLIPNPRCGDMFSLTKKKQIMVFQEGLICPYKSCTEKFVRLRSPANGKETNRYKVYWRHCKEKHNKGKKLGKNAEELDDDYVESS